MNESPKNIGFFGFWIVSMATLIGAGLLVKLLFVPWWLRVRPRFLTPPSNWPSRQVYQQRIKFLGSVALLPTRIGNSRGLFIINLWLAAVVIFCPFTVLLSAVLWPFVALPYRWIWYRLSGK